MIKGNKIKKGGLNECANIYKGNTQNVVFDNITVHVLSSIRILGGKSKIKEWLIPLSFLYM